MNKIICRIHRGEDGLIYWHLRAGNHRIVAGGHQGFASRWNARRAAEKEIAMLRGDVRQTMGFYPDAGGHWRWRRTAANGQIGATSLEGYTRPRDCERALLRLSSKVAEGVRYEVVD